MSDWLSGRSLLRALSCTAPLVYVRPAGQTSGNKGSNLGAIESTEKDHIGNEIEVAKNQTRKWTYDGSKGHTF
jgi:hypothetical protein